MAFTQPTLPQLYAALATIAGQADELQHGYYPAPGKQPLPRSLVVFGATGRIVHGSDQLWMLRVKTHLVIAMKGATELEIQAIDGLLMPLVDQFSADSGDTTGFTLGGLVDHCYVTDWDELGFLGYGGGIRYWGIPVFFEIKHHRVAGG